MAEVLSELGREGALQWRLVALVTKPDNVLIRDDWIRIDEGQFTITDLEKIPEKYQTNLEHVNQ